MQERECHLWQEHFPHLRVVGRGIPLIPPASTCIGNTTTSTINNNTTNNTSALSVTQLRPSNPNDRLRPSAGGPRHRPNASRRGRHTAQPAPTVDVSQVSINVFWGHIAAGWPSLGLMLTHLFTFGRYFGSYLQLSEIVEYCPKLSITGNG